MGVAGRTHAASGLTSVVRWAIVGYLGAGATIGIVAAAEWSWHVLAGGLLLMAVAVIVGALLGFLFGIPRAASADAQAAGQEPT